MDFSPRTPYPGERLTALDVRRHIDHSRASQVIESGNGPVTRTPGGTFIGKPLLRKPSFRIPTYLFGITQSDFSTGTNVLCLACTVDGSTTSGSTFSVFLKSDRSSYSTSNSTKISTATILLYARGTSSDCFVVGTPRTVVTNFQYSTASHTLQVKTRDDWGIFCGTESDWVTKETAETCV